MVGWTFTRMLTPVLMKLNGLLRLRLYNEKSDVIRPYYSLTHHNRSTSSTMYCVVCKLNEWTSQRAHYNYQKYAYGQIAVMLSPIFKVWERMFRGTKAPEEQKFHGCKSSMERQFLDFSLHGSECSREQKYHGKVPQNFHMWTFRSRERKCRGTKSPDWLPNLESWILDLEWWWAEKLAFNAHIFPKIVQISLRWVGGCSIHNWWWKLVPSINDSLWKEMFPDV